MKTCSGIIKDASGAAAIEYGLLVALISIAIIGSLTSLGDSITATIDALMYSQTYTDTTGQYTNEEGGTTYYENVASDNNFTDEWTQTSTYHDTEGDTGSYTENWQNGSNVQTGTSEWDGSSYSFTSTSTGPDTSTLTETNSAGQQQTINYSYDPSTGVTSETGTNFDGSSFSAQQSNQTSTSSTVSSTVLR